jgi:predicted O-methyltransferase YrrM
MATDRCAEIAISRAEVLERLGAPPVEVTELPVYQAARELLRDRGVTIAGAADTAMLYSVCLARQPRTVLETGVAHGLSSLAVLMAMEAYGAGHLTSVDMPYRGSGDDSYVGQAVPADLRARWTLLRMPDRRGIPRATNSGNTFDLVHYDSDKTRSGREFAYPKLWRATKSDGLFLSDDVNDDLAFLEFAERLGLDTMVWAKPGGSSYAGAILKP